MAATRCSPQHLLYTSNSFSSVNLAEEWRRCCLKVMGYDHLAHYKRPRPDQESVTTRKCSRLRLINLVPPSSSSKDKVSMKEKLEPWIETANGMYRNIHQMRRWVEEKKYAYVSVTMSEDEASLIQSTVMSFCATTANEIESLKQLIMERSNNDMLQHQTSIVQILWSDLQEFIARPFAQLQKQRSRVAVQLWKNPLQCRLVHAVSSKQISQDPLDSVLGIEEQQCRNLKFLPTRPSHQLQHNFLSSYQTTITQRSRPKSLFLPASSENNNNQGEDAFELLLSSRDQPNQSQYSRSMPSSHNPPMSQGQGPLSSDSEPFLYTDPNVFEQEAAQLMLTLNSDLDSVQRMETRMIEITTLISQFANLVSEQSESITDIRAQTADAKDNVQKGQDQLIKAKEATQQSKNWTAKAILASSFMLLLFHWIRP